MRGNCQTPNYYVDGYRERSAIRALAGGQINGWSWSAIKEMEYANLKLETGDESFYD
ncbi:hypothetical protein Xmau_01494 [Xenorhabdus mauleonii]|uniref:Uncharacterized protein n=1 Tax=Xenorhabdus mauleonii TaxID=351675 RepID=A0A1I3PJU6_9GAMM|nr:hypothetical protein [Xenorhabdus mauleonii]PHM44780.1 hypothetical protein Xmau_01494 [Xenorhabdus mauleonii]SFJ21617.1 hypothetical protein SAMN05421680_106167 [Xenorhabdus mauleonii]